MAHFCAAATGPPGRFAWGIFAPPLTCGAVSGSPLDLDVAVEKIAAKATQSFGTGTAAMGDTVWVSAAGIDLVLNAVCTQTFHPDAMSNLGLDPRQRKIVIVKSAQHFYAGFAPIAREILYVAGPGAVAPNFADIPLTKLDRPLWPRVDGPFAAKPGRQNELVSGGRTRVV